MGALALVVAFAAGSAVTREIRNAGPAGVRQTAGLLPEAIEPIMTTIKSTIVLDGTVVRDGAVTVTAPVAGQVQGDSPALGSPVKLGDRILAVRMAALGASAPPGDPSPAATFTGPLVVARSPVEGLVTNIVVRPGQTVLKDEPLAMVSPMSFRIEAVVIPELLFRFYGPPLEVRAQFDRGPAPFECPFISIGARIEQGSDPQASPVVVSCQAPDDVMLFAGVKARVAVTTAVAANVIAIPLAALDGTVDRGVVTVVKPNAERERREVELGVNDGVLVEVRSGLLIGEKILKLAPSLLPLASR